jgi:hypothetical protein
MENVTRRSFVSTAAAGIATLGLLAGASDPAEAQLVWTASDWRLAEFNKLVHHPARIKQVWDVVNIGGGKFLSNIKNALNGLHYGYGVPTEQIKIAAALHGPTNMLNYGDYVWEKYGIGEWLGVTDPETQKPAVRNIFYNSKNGIQKESTSKDPDDPGSIFQDTSIEALQSRGVQFMSCHTATEEQAHALVKRNKLSQAPEEIVKDMLAHTQPNVLVNASMVSAIALMQAEGRYTYITL